MNLKIKLFSYFYIKLV